MLFFKLALSHSSWFSNEKFENSDNKLFDLDYSKDVGLLSEDPSWLIRFLNKFKHAVATFEMHFTSLSYIVLLQLDSMSHPIPAMGWCSPACQQFGGLDNPASEN